MKTTKISSPAEVVIRGCAVYAVASNGRELYVGSEIDDKKFKHLVWQAQQLSSFDVNERTDEYAKNAEADLQKFRNEHPGYPDRYSYYYSIGY